MTILSNMFDKHLTSEPPSKTSQNIYSAQSCVKDSDCQTNPNLRGRIFQITLPVERRSIHAPIGGQVNTTVSAGGCRFITGSAGLYQCGCRDIRACHKNRGAAVLTITPRCFLYHDRFVMGVLA